MNDYGIKVVNVGKDITSTDIRDQSMNSEYSMFKYHSDQLGTCTIATGGTAGTVTFNHNLGYVPAYIANFEYLGQQYIVPSIPYGVGFDNWSESYIGTSSLVCKHKLASPLGEYVVYTDQTYYDFDTGSVHVLVGNLSGSSKSGACHFSGVLLDKDQSIVSASLEWTDVASGTTNSDTMFNTYGIDEDDVGNVDTSKTKTTAYTHQHQSITTSNFSFGTDVTDQVREIIARSGWTSGNNMGFIISDDGSASNAYIGGDNNSSANLTIITSTSSLVIKFRGIIFKDKII